MTLTKKFAADMRPISETLAEFKKLMKDCENEYTKEEMSAAFLTAALKHQAEESLLVVPEKKRTEKRQLYRHDGKVEIIDYYKSETDPGFKAARSALEAAYRESGLIE